MCVLLFCSFYILVIRSDVYQINTLSSWLLFSHFYSYFFSIDLLIIIPTLRKAFLSFKVFFSSCIYHFCKLFIVSIYFTNYSPLTILFLSFHYLYPAGHVYHISQKLMKLIDIYQEPHQLHPVSFSCHREQIYSSSCIHE